MIPPESSLSSNEAIFMPFASLSLYKYSSKEGSK